MTREERIVSTFVELVNTMADGLDAVDFLHRVAERCVELLDCGEAGVLLADAAGALRVMASSSERSEALELLQLQHQEGPCFESWARGEPVSSENLRGDAERWPRFAPSALQRGFNSVQAVPMRVRGETVGALNLFRDATGPVAALDMPLAQALADISAAALLQERTLRESRGIVHELQCALTSRIVIEQAKGVLAERAQIGVDGAFTALRNYARQRNLRLSDVARDLLDGRLDPSELSVSTDRPSRRR